MANVSLKVMLYPSLPGTAAMSVFRPQPVYFYVNSCQNVNNTVSSLQELPWGSHSVENLAGVDHSDLQDAISSILFSSQFGECAALAA
ncbi:MAG: hypothetical protein ACRDF4_10500 [Rhabdochlamydiaceae bacterium]